MKNVLYFAVFLSACSNDAGSNNGSNNLVFAKDVHLPTLSADGSDCFEGDSVVLSGGDIVAMNDRIVVADITLVDIADGFYEADTVEEGLTQCAVQDVRLVLKVQAKVVENLLGTGDTVTFAMGSTPLDFWASEPRYLFNNQWVPDYTAYVGGSPLPQIQVSATLGWTENTGLQVGQRLLLFLSDNDGLTPTVFPMGEVGADGVVSFQTLDFAGACLSFPPSFDQATVAAIKATFQEPRVATEYSKFTYPAATMNHCAVSLLPQPDPGDAGHDGN